MQKSKSRLLLAGAAVFIITFSLVALFFGYTIIQKVPGSPIRIACIGDSITEISNYPEDLQAMLGSNYVVGNFGVSGSTVLLGTNRPYMAQTRFLDAKKFSPDIVIILLGTNDAKESFFGSIENFSSQYKLLITQFQLLPSKPAIWLAYPPPVYPNEIGVNNQNIFEGVIPRIAQVADELGLPTIDVYTALTGHAEYFIDGVHPNHDGAYLIASTVYYAIEANA